MAHKNEVQLEGGPLDGHWINNKVNGVAILLKYNIRSYVTYRRVGEKFKYIGSFQYYDKCPIKPDEVLHANTYEHDEYGVEVWTLKA